MTHVESLKELLRIVNGRKNMCRVAQKAKRNAFIPPRGRIGERLGKKIKAILPCFKVIPVSEIAARFGFAPGPLSTCLCASF
jgi:hypothetical protein